MTPERLPRDMEILRSQLRTFSTLASHLRSSQPRNEGEIVAVEQEVDAIRFKLYGVATPEPRVEPDSWLDEFCERMKLTQETK